MSFLIASDLHLTESPKDEYRWGLFPWMEQQIKQQIGLKYVLLLGDLTDKKDYHSSALVNRIVEAINSLTQYAEVIILKGNHDYIEASNPFFRFLELLDLRVHFISEPLPLVLDDDRMLFLPSTRNWEEDYGHLKFKEYDFIFAHQTFTGALGENGTALDGVPADCFGRSAARIISGDIHVPQKLGRIEYAGSPYRVHFGDKFKPRCMLVRSGKDDPRKIKEGDLTFPCISRELIEAVTVDDVAKHKFPKGTQVKIRIRLKRSEFAQWSDIKAQLRALAEKREWDLCGGLELKAIQPKPSADREEAGEGEEADRLTAAQELSAFGKRKRLDREAIKAGLEFLKEAQQ